MTLPTTLPAIVEALKKERARIFEEIHCHLIDAAHGNVEPGVGVEPIRALLDQGCDLEADVLPTVARTVPELPRPSRTEGAQWLVRLDANPRLNIPMGRINQATMNFLEYRRPLLPPLPIRAVTFRTILVLPRRPSCTLLHATNTCCATSTISLETPALRRVLHFICRAPSCNTPDRANRATRQNHDSAVASKRLLQQNRPFASAALLRKAASGRTGHDRLDWIGRV
jgi:hypothetical protein